MTLTNITENRIINAAGRLIDPKKTIFMDVEYYASHKSFIDQYVSSKQAEVGGLDEYEAYLQGGKAAKEDNEPTDLIAEVLSEEDGESTDEAPDDKQESKEEAEVEQEEKPKTTRRRRSRG